MDQKRRRGKTVNRALLGCLLFAALILRPAVCYAEDENPPFTITVEEEIPAQEIEESSVPLAAFAQEDKTPLTVVIVCAVTAAICAAAYLLYFARLKKRLRALRAEAAGAEQRWVASYRNGRRITREENGR